MFSGKLSFKNLNGLLKTLSNVFVVCSILLTVYILVMFFMIQKNLSNPIIESPILKQTTARQPLIPSYPDFSQYVTGITDRDLFNLPKEKKKIIIQPVEKKASPEDLTKDIKVIGIMLTNNNPQVLIQHKSSSDTELLSIGSKINDLILKDIQKDKIIFDYQGDSLEVSI